VAEVHGYMQCISEPNCMYCASICMYLGKYLHIIFSRYIKIDQIVFDKNIYTILSNRFTDVDI
jgi:hypothetical protein